MRLKLKPKGCPTIRQVLKMVTEFKEKYLRVASSEVMLFIPKEHQLDYLPKEWIFGWSNALENSNGKDIEDYDKYGYYALSALRKDKICEQTTRYLLDQIVQQYRCEQIQAYADKHGLRFLEAAVRLDPKVILIKE